MMETSPAGITRVDAEGRVVYANRRAEKILGIRLLKDMERTYNDPEWKITDFNGGPYPEENLPFPVVKATGQPVFDVRHAIQWPCGRRVFLSINAAPLLGADGSFDGMVSTIEYRHVGTPHGRSFFR
jgi:PAS domain-containing protein